MYFMEGKIGREYPPAISHPEFYYGFLGAGLAWQVAFLLMARDPAKYRTMMIPAMLEKALYGVAIIVLYQQHRLATPIFAGGMVDWIFLILLSPPIERRRRIHSMWYLRETCTKD
jgi:hypothetical protein